MPETMTNRRRIVDTLLCKPTDRPAMPYWMGFAPWNNNVLEQWRKDSGIADLDPAVYFGFDRYFQWTPLQCGPFPAFEFRVLAEDAEHLTFVDGRGIISRNRRDATSMPEFIKHPVANWDDWNRYKAERLQPRLAERTGELAAFAEASAKVDAPIQVGGAWGPFGTARDMMGAEALLYAFLDEPELVHDIMSTYADLWLATFEAAADAVTVDCINIWEDMSGRQGSLISMAMVEEFMAPHYDRIAAFARRRGIPLISVDSDGMVDELTPVLMKHGMNVFYPFEVQAGNDIVAVRRQYPTLGIAGGLDKRALARGPREIHVELDRAAAMFAAGGYLVGFDHGLPPDVTWANYKYAVEHLRAMVGL